MHIIYDLHILILYYYNLIYIDIPHIQYYYIIGCMYFSNWIYLIYELIHITEFIKICVWVFYK